MQITREQREAFINLIVALRDALQSTEEQKRERAEAVVEDIEALDDLMIG